MKRAENTLYGKFRFKMSNLLFHLLFQVTSCWVNDSGGEVLGNPKSPNLEALGNLVQNSESFQLICKSGLSEVERKNREKTFKTVLDKINKVSNVGY